MNKDILIHSELFSSILSKKISDYSQDELKHAYEVASVPVYYPAKSGNDWHDKVSGQFTSNPEKDIVDAKPIIDVDSKEIVPTNNKTDKKSKLKSDSNQSTNNKSTSNSSSFNVVDFGNGLAKVVKKSADAIPKNDNKIKKYAKYPNLTDQELAERINRINLEQKYSDLVGDTKVRKANSEYVREGLQTTGAMLALATSIIGLFTSKKNS